MSHFKAQTLIVQRISEQNNLTFVPGMTADEKLTLFGAWYRCVVVAFISLIYLGLTIFLISEFALHI